jgi:chitinase
MLLKNDSVAVGIFSPSIKNDEVSDSALQQKIAELRAQGEVVVQSLDDDEVHLRTECCDRQLILNGNKWEVQTL